jgi:hypothetical protein
LFDVAEKDVASATHEPANTKAAIDLPWSHRTAAIVVVVDEHALGEVQTYSATPPLTFEEGVVQIVVDPVLGQRGLTWQLPLPSVECHDHEKRRRDRSRW